MSSDYNHFLLEVREWAHVGERQEGKIFAHSEKTNVNEEAEIMCNESDEHFVNFAHALRPIETRWLDGRREFLFNDLFSGSTVDARGDETGRLFTKGSVLFMSS